MATKKKLPPYYVELGYELRRDGLFHKTYTSPRGAVVHLVEVPAEDLHRIRKHNLRACGVEASHA